MIKAIDTNYKGYKFRSRLEARFAVFLDALNVDWDYEIEGFDLPMTGKYLPDFFLPKNGLCGLNTDPLWVEVKAGIATEEETDKLRELAVMTKITGAFFYGSGPYTPNHFKEWFEGCYDGHSIPVLSNFQYPLNSFSPCNSGRLGVDNYFTLNSWIFKFSGETCVNRLRTGAKAALSARFEFGESG